LWQQLAATGLFSINSYAPGAQLSFRAQIIGRQGFSSISYRQFATSVDNICKLWYAVREEGMKAEG
jgi:hypothetical protein